MRHLAIFILLVSGCASHHKKKDKIYYVKNCTVLAPGIFDCQEISNDRRAVSVCTDPGKAPVIIK